MFVSREMWTDIRKSVNVALKTTKNTSKIYDNPQHCQNHQKNVWMLGGCWTELWINSQMQRQFNRWLLSRIGWYLLSSNYHYDTILRHLIIHCIKLLALRKLRVELWLILLFVCVCAQSTNLPPLKCKRA